MPTADQMRLDAARARPRLVELWWALRPTLSVIRFMQSGAHPDDETSAMLAAIGLRDGINLSYACSTRGEGGQNDIGTEAGTDLGALRTREMERACDVLGMRMYWHSESAEDPITDFGFSKSGQETLGKWGRDRTLARFVEILRTDRPDILCPTFLDVPGQHGHHRAMTEAAHLVIEAAADPGFASNLPPWRVPKLYLPAWSGAGQAYDDDLPPPPATLTVPGHGKDPVTGWSWELIGQMSRGYHRTQGMGRWVAPGAGRDFALHLAVSAVPGPDTALSSGLPATVGALADLPGADAIAHDLRRADDAIRAAVAAFPDSQAVAGHARAAHDAVCAARAACPDALRDAIVHRLDAKATQLAHVLRLALGAEARAWAGGTWLSPGSEVPLTVESHPGDADAVSVALDLPAGWHAGDDSLGLSETAAPTDGYRAAYDPACPPAPALVLSLGGATARIAMERPPVVLPARTGTLDPQAAVVNRTMPPRPLRLSVSGLRPQGAHPALILPDGWAAVPFDGGFEVTLPPDTAPGLYECPLTLDGAPAMSVRLITHEHIDPTATARPAVFRVRVLDAALPGARVGYIGSGNDRVGHWLRAMGADVTDLSDADLESRTALDAFDSIVVGIFAMRFRAGLSAAMPRLHDWTRAGGTLVTLYHRPWDNWDPDGTPPRRLEIGQPSLRWRVTDETAAVRHLADHPVLSAPNPIGSADWDGWVKERGLYFAKAWDDAYVPLLQMADPDEAPLDGALLVADIGKGRHVHTSLILHHQMENLVPGAFRLMANLIAPRE